MAEFTVTSTELQGRANDLERLNGTLQQKITQLETEEAALSGMWEGDSHSAFDKNFRSSRAKMNAFHAEITKYVGALRTIASKYEAAERRNVTTASGS